MGECTSPGLQQIDGLSGGPQVSPSVEIAQVPCEHEDRDTTKVPHDNEDSVRCADAKKPRVLKMWPSDASTEAPHDHDTEVIELEESGIYEGTAVTTIDSTGLKINEHNVPEEPHLSTCPADVGAKVEVELFGASKAPQWDG